ncbi:hypothetical protein ACNKHO_11155 [Shigella flexneri]
MGFRRRVRMFSLDPANQQARESASALSCSSTTMPVSTPEQLEGQTDLGFAGFRVFKAPSWRDANASPSSAQLFPARWTAPISTAYPHVV